MDWEEEKTRGRRRRFLEGLELALGEEEEEEEELLNEWREV